MEKMIKELNELMLLEKTPANWKKFHKLYMKAAETYANFYGRDIAEGMLYVDAQIR